MTPRERVLTALRHQVPDRVPIDLAATTVTSITCPAYHRLREFLGLKPDPAVRLSHLHQGTVHAAEDLLQHYAVDFRTVTMPKSPRAFVVRHLDEERFEDEYGIVWKRSTYDYSPMVAPLAAASIEDIGRASWPDPKDPARVRGLAEEAKRLFETTEYAVVADIMCRGPFELAVKLRGMEQFLTDLVLDERFADALLERIRELLLGLWDVYLEAVGPYAQVVCQGDDVGMQTGLLLSPQLYRRFIKPVHRAIYGRIRERTGAKIFMHSCGSIREIIPDLIEVGVDALNPIQRNARGMDIHALKREFGRDLCFWGGGIDVQRDLPGASLEEIERTVRQTVEGVGEGGGYVFALTHNLQPDVEPRKVDWAYRSALARPAL